MQTSLCRAVYQIDIILPKRRPLTQPIIITADNKNVILLYEDIFAGLMVVGSFGCVSLNYYPTANLGRRITNDIVLIITPTFMLN